jgi:hypothetical protein
MTALLGGQVTQVATTVAELIYSHVHGTCVVRLLHCCANFTEYLHTNQDGVGQPVNTASC